MGKLAIAFTVAFAVWAAAAIAADLSYVRAVEGHLKRAADANTVELAISEMETATANARNRGLTDGFTSIFYQTPDEDIGFWFRNLTAALEELRALPADVTPLERTNVLMKLRETLLDGAAVTQPCGISRFPNNGAWAFFGWLFALAACGFGIAKVERNF